MLLLCLAARVLLLSAHPQGTPPAHEDARARIDATPELRVTRSAVAIRFPNSAEQAKGVSWVEPGPRGTLYLVQRGPDAPPFLQLDAEGNVQRAWGAGDTSLPHSLRVDHDGTLWTVDANSSQVSHYTAGGVLLSSFQVGEMPDTGSPFRGAADLGFLPNGHLLLADGYGNARLLEYTREGKRIRSIGIPGSAPGQFHLPHAVTIAPDGLIYVADRENDRVEVLAADGHFLRLYDTPGRVYDVQVAGGFVWVSGGPQDQPPGSAHSWVLQLDRTTGKLLGHIDLPEARSGHCLALTPPGDLLVTQGDGVVHLHR